MSNIAKAFMVTAVICLLIGMAWGIQMSATHDHTLSPAHGHLNLLGFVVMSITGLYYAVTPSAAASRLATFHFVLLVVAVAILVPGIAMAISESGETLAKLGSVLSLLTIVLHGVIVLRFGVGKNGGSTDPQTGLAEATT